MSTPFSEFERQNYRDVRNHSRLAAANILGVDYNDDAAVRLGISLFAAEFAFKGRTRELTAVYLAQLVRFAVYIAHEVPFTGEIENLIWRWPRHLIRNELLYVPPPLSRRTTHAPGVWRIESRELLGPGDGAPVAS